MRFHNRVMGSTGGLLIGAMMILIVLEVLSRFFLKSSIEGIIETVGIFLALAVFFGFSPCEEEGAHVRVELLVRCLPNKVALALDVFVYVMAIVIVAVSAWQVGLDALSSFKIREVLPGAKVQVPVYPAKIAAFVGYLAFCFQLVVNFMGKLRPSKKSSSTI